jgi:nucleotide-binding universal stress UspA family protein
VSIRNILVHVDGTSRTSATIGVALGLAAARGARLTGLFVVQPPPGRDNLEEGVATWCAQAAAGAERTFRRLTDGAGVAAQWASVWGRPLEAVARTARSSDLVVLGQGAEADATEASRMAVGVALAAGRPVLMVPRSGDFPVIGHHVLVAWSDSRESTRALHDALPILAAAERTVLLLVNPSDGEEPALGRPGVGDQLSAHGVRATVLRSFANRIDIGKAILTRAHDAHADLVVMGVRGNVAQGRLVLGRTTGHVLSNATLPVLMSN